MRTAALTGIDAAVVYVEVDVSFGLPIFTMVGLPDACVRESRDRVRAAIRNSGFEFPAHRITVNLSPGDVRKAGASFDLPIALGILAAQGVIRRREATDVVILGELSLDGGIQPARGVLPIAAAAVRQGAGQMILPRANAAEAGVVAGLAVLPVSTLTEAVAALNDPTSIEVVPHQANASTADEEADLADVHGQLLARRALEVASAGGHNLLLVGPPGAGKTMMARRVPGIMPPMSLDEALEASSVHSVAGLLPPGGGLLTRRPFRAPHHTISNVALVGGGSHARPGEVSLAHHGVLFLDELLEFHRHVLEVLRQPLEEGRVVIARAARTAVFPARFVLIGAMNPCPCGFAGDLMRECRCPPQHLFRYRQRLSGPLRDRLDLAVEVAAVPPDTLDAGVAGERSAAVRARVIAARDVQRDRYASTLIRTNGELTTSLLAEHCRLNRAGGQLMRVATERLALSARGYDRVRRVARTIADLAGSKTVEAEHVAEALQFRASF